MLKAALSALRPRRYSLALPLRVWIRSWGKGKTSSTEEPVVEEETSTENISSAGCYFLLSDRPAIGSRVEMEIKMAAEPGREANSKVLCRGRVVRIEKGRVSGKTGVGCAFERYQIISSAKSC